MAVRRRPTGHPPGGTGDWQRPTVKRMKETLLKINRGIGWVQVKILSPVLLTVLWLLLGLSCALPRLLGTRFLRPFRRGGETHWLEHAPIDVSLRGLKRQG